MAISIKLMGGLGNLMFQTCAVEYLGKRFGLKTCYPNIKEHIAFLDGGGENYSKHAHEFPLIFKNFDWHINEGVNEGISSIVRVPFKYDHITHVEDNTQFIGYFQSEEFWGGERDFAQRLFEPSDFVNEQLLKYSNILKDVTCAIHIRRGNYLKYPNIYQPIGNDYINKAKTELEKHCITKYLVFSDDIRWCKENLKGDYLFIEEPKDYLSMFLMAKCNFRIISPSSFGWWSTYLNETGGNVIAPKQWILDPKIDSSHVIPWHWQTI